MGARKTGTAGESRGAPQLPAFLASEALNPFISNDLMVRLLGPLPYRPKHGGRTAVLHTGPVDSPVKAVRASILAQESEGPER